jgi:hypothetical protein
MNVEEGSRTREGSSGDTTLSPEERYETKRGEAKQQAQTLNAGLSAG